MGLPIIELIAQNIERTINDVTTGNGYLSTLVAERGKRSNRVRDNLVVIHQLDPDPIDAPQAHLGWRVPFALNGYIVESDSSTTPLDQRANIMWADIVKALRVDVSRGQYAYDTEISPPAGFPDAGPLEGIAINIAIKYRHLENDPTAQ